LPNPGAVRPFFLSVVKNQFEPSPFVQGEGDSNQA
jgi:hypothetical protein